MINQVRIKQKSSVDAGFNVKHNYSGFWMDRSSNEQQGSSNAVKLVKLNSYKRAITNFVKIVTKKDLPVYWNGSTSYTDGSSIVLSTDIKDNNFDVMVGLALHEASHCILSDFDLVKNLFGVCNQRYMDCRASQVAYIKDLLNWIEDRRIDNYIFTTSPGYKAYYHKLYHYYWHTKEIEKAMKRPEYRIPTLDNYRMHIINMISPAFDPAALPSLDKIKAIINLPNISRLKSTAEALEIAFQVYDIINAEVSSDQADWVPPQESEQTSLEEIDSEKLAEELQGQKDFGAGKIGKKSNASKKILKELENLEKIDAQAVTLNEQEDKPLSGLLLDYTKGSHTINLVYDRIIEAGKASNVDLETANSVQEAYEKNNYITNECFKLLATTTSDRTLGLNDFIRNNMFINRGFEMGSLLGKKLQLHNAVRETTTNRLTHGKIDSRRLAHAGYGIENIFSQIRVEQYKKANLHISLDVSGSMDGSKWDSTLQMTAAIVKAATFAQGITVQVSLRGNIGGQTPLTVMAYDSSINDLGHFRRVMALQAVNSATPEGLCFETLIKLNKLKKGTENCNSFFINISDGEPSMIGYSGYPAMDHTERMVKRMSQEYNMQILAFFIDTKTKDLDSSYSGKCFQKMYGRASAVVDPSSAIQIAAEMNKKFLVK